MRPLTHAFVLALAAQAWAAPIPDLTLTPIPVADRLAVNPDVVTLMPDGDRIGFGNSVFQRFGYLRLDGSGTSFPFTLPDGRLESHAVAPAGPDTVAIIGRVINSDATQAFRSVIIEGNVVNGQFQVHDIPTQDACFNVANRCDIVGLTAGGVVYTMGDKGRVGLLSSADVFREELIVIPNPRGTPRINAITLGPDGALYMTDERNEAVIRTTPALDGFAAFLLDPARARSRMDPFGIAPFGSDSVVITESGLAPEGGKIGIVNISTGAFREIEPGAAAQFLQEIAAVSAEAVLAIDEFKRELVLVNINTGEVLQSQTADRALDVLPLASSSSDKTRVFINTLNLSQGFDVTPQIAEFRGGGAQAPEPIDLRVVIAGDNESTDPYVRQLDVQRNPDSFIVLVAATNDAESSTNGEVVIKLKFSEITTDVTHAEFLANTNPAKPTIAGMCNVAQDTVTCTTVDSIAPGEIAGVRVRVQLAPPLDLPADEYLIPLTASVQGGGIEGEPEDNEVSKVLRVKISRDRFITDRYLVPVPKSPIGGRSQ